MIVQAGHLNKMIELGIPKVKLACGFTKKMKSRKARELINSSSLIKIQNNIRRHVGLLQVNM